MSAPTDEQLARARAEGYRREVAYAMGLLTGSTPFVARHPEVVYEGDHVIVHRNKVCTMILDLDAVRNQTNPKIK